MVMRERRDVLNFFFLNLKSDIQYKTKLNYSYAQLFRVSLFTAQKRCYGIIGSNLSGKLTIMIVALPETVEEP